jgi:hypothetical protein
MLSKVVEPRAAGQGHTRPAYLNTSVGGGSTRNRQQPSISNLPKTSSLSELRPFKFSVGSLFSVLLA